MGTGHLRRCLTLADALRARGVRSTFVMRRHDNFLEAMTLGEHSLAMLPPGVPAGDRGGSHAEWLGAGWEDDAEQTLAALGGEVDLLVVDHYALDARWEHRLRPQVGRLLVIDDLADRQHACDLLLDATPRDPGDYAALVAPETELLVGPRYALLRPEFAARRELGRQRKQIERILVSFGGSDPADFTGRTLRVLAGVPHPPHVDVVLTRGAPHLDAVRTLAVNLPGCRLHVDTEQMADLMEAADLAIGAGGTTSWERLCLGLPAIVTPIADNQLGVVEALRAYGAAIEVPAGRDYERRLGEALGFLAGQPGVIADMSCRAAATVDGRGANRVAARLTTPVLEVRRAGTSDMQELWEWRNHPLVRAASRDGRTIELNAHAAWFEATLRAPDRDLLVVSEARGGAIAVLRFDVDADGQAAEISIYATPAGLGRGLGALALRAGERWLAAHRPSVVEIRAVIREGNAASVAAFESAGYTPALRTLVRKVTT